MVAFSHPGCILPVERHRRALLGQSSRVCGVLIEGPATTVTGFAPVQTIKALVGRLLGRR
ncbi:MAG: hypothetical protein M3P37_13425 [Actinomycetota bacterium]|nr:hypothetical protein [Actinomycetota bacterium]